ncbi:DUF3565 domain-containing protein [Minwuia thermotolerans]|uniref:DUF3565 domain-containing protein n=1 Tax=Minwuia thermotolerans TaxID=2056226 RepID=A0A2M9FVF0_9PROT|nr:DUF3565 domain-containing protein [Minwuia thermotolerans]PJK27409.1 DUF3565 domain-containing protein [Minwuia thermotolerans]
MQRRITGFGLDDKGERFARLDCGHRQHVRHRPPFVERPWAESEAGRASMLGETLDCLRCDRLEMPDGVTPYRETPVFDQATVPAGLLKDHETKPGTWGRLEVLAGRMRCVFADPVGRAADLGAGENSPIPPEASHHVELHDGARFRVVFLRVAADGG